MFEDKTPEGIKDSILKKLPGWSTQSGSFANTLVSAAAYEIWQCYITLDSLLPMFYVDETSGEYIDLKCADYGITRKAGTKAAVTLSLVAGRKLTIPAYTGFCTLDGLVFYTDEELIITEAGTPSPVSATAAEAGTVYNVGAAAIVSPLSGMSGLHSITNQQAASGGTDAESDEALVARLYTRLRKPPTSGNVYHYEQWALEISGVGFVKVTPLWDGPGTVRVLLADSAGNTVGTDTVDAVRVHIEAERPIGADVTVMSAAAKPLNITATVLLDGSKSVSEVETAFEKLLKDYLKELIFKTYSVSRNRIAFLLLSVPGVADYSSLTINGLEGNVGVGASEIPVLDALSITEVV